MPCPTIMIFEVYTPQVSRWLACLDSRFQRSVFIKTWLKLVTWQILLLAGVASVQLQDRHIYLQLLYVSLQHGGEPKRVVDQSVEKRRERESRESREGKKRGQNNRETTGKKSRTDHNPNRANTNPEPDSRSRTAQSNRTLRERSGNLLVVQQGLTPVRLFQDPKRRTPVRRLPLNIGNSFGTMIHYFVPEQPKSHMAITSESAHYGRKADCMHKED